MVAATHRGCSDEVVTIAAMLSAPPCYHRPRWASKAADRAHKSFTTGPGDHTSMLATFAQYLSSDSKSEFCKDYFLMERSLKQAQSIHRQLSGIIRNRGLAKEQGAPAENLTQAIRKSFIEGFFMQSAHIDQSGKVYVTVRDNQLVNIHPSSFLQHKPEW